MSFRLPCFLCLWTFLTLWVGMDVSWFIASAAEPFSLKNYVPPTPNSIDEPLAKQFSLEKAARFLDSASLHWRTKSRCVTCHTDCAYLYSRPLISADDPAPREIRQAFEKYIKNTLEDFGKGSGRDGGYYAIAAAVSLALNDSITTKRLHPLTRRGLDHIWRSQSKDGAIAWGGGTAPVGSTQFGLMIVSIAVGAAPDGYAKTEAAQKGLARIRTWLANHPPENLHEKAMLLWASCYHDGFLTPKERAKTIAELRAKQLTDGGWSLPGLGEWQRQDGFEPLRDGTKADGYATGLTVYVLRQAGVSARDAAIQRGIAWLKSNQRESGRWFTRSLYHRHGPEYLTHIGSAFAVMAIQACKESPPARRSPTDTR